ncbi:hypothetical protein JKP88DRAFT_264000 [Tribonema minus]|uniref:Uncharacterized protein n=1 Tax=Tribonema minus TaxID=303371 RepID=A0A835YTF3_9STRA|nr:hypothetical protein JKP88DRAFT_264000 [Tribonema minus]
MGTEGARASVTAAASSAPAGDTAASSEPPAAAAEPGDAPATTTNNLTSPTPTSVHSPPTVTETGHEPCAATSEPAVPATNNHLPSAHGHSKASAASAGEPGAGMPPPGSQLEAQQSSADIEAARADAAGCYGITSSQWRRLRARPSRSSSSRCAQHSGRRRSSTQRNGLNSIATSNSSTNGRRGYRRGEPGERVGEAPAPAGVIAAVSGAPAGSGAAASDAAASSSSARLADAEQPPPVAAHGGEGVAATVRSDAEEAAVAAMRAMLGAIETQNVAADGNAIAAAAQLQLAGSGGGDASAVATGTERTPYSSGGGGPDAPVPVDIAPADTSLATGGAIHAHSVGAAAAGNGGTPLAAPAGGGDSSAAAAPPLPPLAEPSGDVAAVPAANGVIAQQQQADMDMTSAEAPQPSAPAAAEAAITAPPAQALPPAAPPAVQQRAAPDEEPDVYDPYTPLEDDESAAAAAAEAEAPAAAARAATCAALAPPRAAAQLVLSGAPRAALLPVRIDLRSEGGLRYVDSLLWDAADAALSPEAFAAATAADLALPRKLEAPLARAIRAQVVTAQATLPVWSGSSGAAAMYPAGEALVPIELELRLGAVLYRDKFEWDMNEPLNSPEAFAARTVADLALPQPMEPAIALALREQLANYRQLTRSARAVRLVDEAIVAPAAVAAAAAAADAVKAEQRPPGSPPAKRLRTLPPLSPGHRIRSAADGDSGARISLLTPRDQMELRSGAWRALRPSGGGSGGGGGAPHPLLPQRTAPYHLGLRPQFTAPSAARHHVTVQLMTAPSCEEFRVLSLPQAAKPLSSLRCRTRIVHAAAAPVERCTTGGGGAVAARAAATAASAKAAAAAAAAATVLDIGIGKATDMAEAEGGGGLPFGTNPHGADLAGVSLAPRPPPDVSHLRGLPLQQQLAALAHLMVLPLQRVIPGAGGAPPMLVLEKDEPARRRGRRSHADMVRKQEEDDQQAALQSLGYAVQLVPKAAPPAGPR